MNLRIPDRLIFESAYQNRVSFQYVFHNVYYYKRLQAVCQPEIRLFFNLHTLFSRFLVILLLLSHFLICHFIFTVFFHWSEWTKRGLFYCKICGKWSASVWFYAIITSGRLSFSEPEKICRFCVTKAAAQLLYK